MTELSQDRCEPCEGGVEPFNRSEAEELLEQVDDWSLVDVPKIERSFSFSDFEQAIEFVNRMAEISEREDHHPNFSVNYNVVDVTIWTHAIDGLSRNDFILAAKLDEVYEELQSPVA